MGRSYQTCMQRTGCRRFAILEGERPKNVGLLLLVWLEQEKEVGGNVKGRVTVLEAGAGEYCEYFRRLVGLTDFADAVASRVAEFAGERRVTSFYANSFRAVGGLF